MTNEVIENKPSVKRFEQAVAQKQYETACGELLSILGGLDSGFGAIEGIDIEFPIQLQNDFLQQERIEYFCTRLATAISELFSDKDLIINETGAIRFLSYQRWLNMIFASSPFVNADHVLQVYNVKPNAEDGVFYLEATEAALIKFCILYLPESTVNINLDALWNLNPSFCASLCFALQSPRFIGTSVAFDKRAAILKWFPEKLATLPNLNQLPSSISHDVYMHCSYDIDANKHLVKKSLNQVIRRHLLAEGWQDIDVSQHVPSKKPVMVVLLEHFHSAHSIYRTHSTSMIAAKEHFHLIGIGKDGVDEAGRAVFDEFVLINESSVITNLQHIREVCEKNNASVLYMPSIGMDLMTIFASNTRLAPIQVVALGHPATTHSDFIEYVIVEDDYVGSEECFSETLIRLPKDALPYVPSSLAPTSVEYQFRKDPEVVNIGVASTTMKLNPYFLSACREILNRSSVPVHFHFALGQSSGVTHPYVARFIKSYLGDHATAHPHAPYDAYLRILYKCDMMINPFPFGNTNGIIDMVTLGMVGVCKTGPEVHEHIDEGLFKRLGLPEWLITQTADDYVATAVRLAENHAERNRIRKKMIKDNGLQTLFTGDARPFGQILSEKVNALVSAKASAKSAPAPTKEKKPAQNKAKPTSKTKKSK